MKLKKKHQGLQNLKLSLDSSAVTSQSQVRTQSIDWSKDILILWTVEPSDGSTFGSNGHTEVIIFGNDCFIFK